MVECIVFGTVYHTWYPDGASDAAMIDYLFLHLRLSKGAILVVVLLYLVTSTSLPSVGYKLN